MRTGHEPSQVSLTIGERVGPFRLLGELGRGSMGTVFEAEHERIGRRVAIKILDARLSQSAEATRRFFTEARAVNRIEHPGVVEVHDCLELPDGSCAIVMELIRGESLAERMHGTGLSHREALRLCGWIAGAISAAHAKGIVHRDLKPENVMLLPGGQLKVLDFGLAKMDPGEEDPGPWQVQTHEATLLGTPLYMAPEQCKGAGGVGPQADVYALGVMLYQMLAGVPPFSARGAGELLAMHIYAQVPPLAERADLPEALVELVHGMLRKAPEDRPTMREVESRVSGLERCLPEEDEAPVRSERLVNRAPSTKTVLWGASAATSTPPAKAASSPALTVVVTPAPATSAPAGRAASAAPIPSVAPRQASSLPGPSLTLWAEGGTAGAGEVWAGESDEGPTRRRWPIALAAMGIIVAVALTGISARGRRSGAPDRAAMATPTPARTALVPAPGSSPALAPQVRPVVSPLLGTAARPAAVSAPSAPPQRPPAPAVRAAVDVPKRMRPAPLQAPTPTSKKGIQSDADVEILP